MAPIDVLTESRIRSIEIILTHLLNQSGMDIDTSNAPNNQTALIRLAEKLEGMDDNGSELEHAGE